MQRVTGQLAELAELAALAAEEAEQLLANAKRALRRAETKADKLRERGVHDPVAGRRRGRLARAVNHLTELLAATRQIVGTEQAARGRAHPQWGQGRVHPADGRPRPTDRLGRRGRSGTGAKTTSTTTKTGSTTPKHRASHPHPHLSPGRANIRGSTS